MKPSRTSRYSSWIIPVHLGPEKLQSLRTYFDQQWALAEPQLAGVYTSHPQMSSKDPAHRSYGGNLPRLQQVKQKYEPMNVFFRPHSVLLPQQ